MNHVIPTSIHDRVFFILVLFAYTTLAQVNNEMLIEPCLQYLIVTIIIVGESLSDADVNEHTRKSAMWELYSMCQQK